MEETQPNKIRACHGGKRTVAARGAIGVERTTSSAEACGKRRSEMDERWRLESPWENPEISSTGTRMKICSVETLEVNENTKQEDANSDRSSSSSVQVTCFTDLVDDITFNLQIIRLANQIYAWIGCNSSKLGGLYATAPTRPISYNKSV
ncbi:hypothetical protein QYF36_007228 [Acer negundo]|nr:hypothetical protein QYF36_007228 [Acer negundo]